MDIELPAGRYVVAVSGGVDSIALLDLLAGQPQLQLTIAHFDHGIRPDSSEDRRLVQKLARQYKLPVVYGSGKLGPGASEATARAARYTFLHHVREASGASAIVTAHHQDDLLETAILNILRGTSRHGLSSMRSMDVVKRPLLHISKAELQAYATDHNLTWREDSTNSDERYLRNYVRLKLMPRFDTSDRQAFLDLLMKAQVQNKRLDEQLTNYLHLQSTANSLDRHAFIQLPHVVAREILAAWLRAHTSTELSKALLERLVVASKTGLHGRHFDVDKTYQLEVSKDLLALKPRER